MVSYRILAHDVPSADSQLNIGFTRIWGEMGLGASDMTPDLGLSTIVTDVAFIGHSPALLNPEPMGVKGLDEQWQAGGSDSSISSISNPHRDEHNDFSSLTTEFATGPISRLGLESGGIASCRPPS